MINKSRLTWIGLLVLVLAACIKDPGNYDYIDSTEAEPFSLTNWEDTQERFSTLERLQKTPTLSPGVNEEDYEYVWYLNGKISDTIARTLKLDVQLTQPNGDYKLIFRAQNRKTGVCVYHTMGVTIESEFARGWYITKDENQVTDIDWINPEGELFPNVLASINGEGLKGKAHKTTFMGTGYNYDQHNPDGTVELVTGKRVLFVMSRSDMRVYNSDDLTLIRNFDEIFVSGSEVAKPQAVAHTVTASFAVNNGRAYSLNVMNAVSYSKFGSDKLGDYHLSDYVIPHLMGSMLAFDEQSSSFCTIKTAKTIQPFTYTPGHKHNPNNMNCDLLFMQDRSPELSVTNPGVALLKNRDKEEYYYAEISIIPFVGFNANLFSKYEVIPNTSELGKGKVFGAHLFSSALYFSLGDNVLKSFNTGNFSENSNVKTFPQGENISFIGHINDSEVKCLAVLTNTTDSWHLYCFEFIGQTADIDLNKCKHYSGKGHAASVFYMNTDVSYIN